MLKHLYKCLGLLLGFATMTVWMAGCSDSGNSALGGSTVTVNITDGKGIPQRPYFLAYKDGNQPWHKLSVEQSTGTYLIPLTNAEKKYGIAIVDSAESDTTTVIYATTNEMAHFTHTIWGSTSGSTLSGSITGNAGGTTYIYCDGSYDWFSGNTYNLNDISDGSHSLFAVHFSSDDDYTPDKMVVKTITVGGTDDHNIDLTTQGSYLSPRYFTATKSSSVEDGGEYLWSPDFGGNYVFVGGYNTTTSCTYAALPTGFTPPTGLLYNHYLSDNGSWYDVYSSTPNDVDLSDISLPNQDAATINSEATACSWTKFDTAKLYEVYADDGSHYLDCYVSAGWLGTAVDNSYSLSLPDFSTLSGWNSTWAPNIMTNVNVSAIDLNASMENYVSASLNYHFYDGYAVRFINYGGVVPPPPPPPPSLNGKALSVSHRHPGRHMRR